jgi:hypothetical protein
MVCCAFYRLHTTTPGKCELAYMQDGTSNRVILDGLDLTSLSPRTPLTGGAVDFVMQLKIARQPIPAGAVLLDATRSIHLIEIGSEMTRDELSMHFKMFRDETAKSVVAVTNVGAPARAHRTLARAPAVR